jgi:hypothetical protein
MTKSEFENPITKKWFDKANVFEPKEGTNYEWVWEYAKLRLAWAGDRVQQAEARALEFLKLVIGSAAAGWAVLTFLKVDPSQLSTWTVGCLLVCLELLLGAAYFAGRAYLPTKRIIPIAEDAALRCADEYPRGTEGVAKFCQTLSPATEKQTQIAASKARFVLSSAYFLTVAVIVFLSAVFLGGGR